MCILKCILSVPKCFSKKNEDIPVLVFIRIENGWGFSRASVQNHFKFIVLPVAPPSAQPRVLVMITNRTV